MLVGQVARPSDPAMSLTAGAGFGITSTFYPSPACSGATPVLYPGVTDCVVFTVSNSLSVPITVQSITMALSSAPAGCVAADFSLPTFSGNLSVPAGGTATTPGLPVSLVETGTNEDACETSTLGFTYSGNAQYTDTTSTALVASPTSTTAGQTVTLTATVSAADAGSDPSGPAGTVTFDSCPTSACTSGTPLGTASVGAGGVATLTTSSLPVGSNLIEAVYGGSGTDFGGSTSPVVTVTVAAATAPATTTPTTSRATGSSAASATTTTTTTTTKTTPVAFTGADISGMVTAAAALIGAGTVLLVLRRRRRVAR
jgi:hypothetical protein